MRHYVSAPVLYTEGVVALLLISVLLTLAIVLYRANAAEEPPPPHRISRKLPHAQALQ